LRHGRDTTKTEKIQTTLTTTSKRAQQVDVAPLGAAAALSWINASSLFEVNWFYKVMLET